MQLAGEQLDYLRSRYKTPVDNGERRREEINMENLRHKVFRLLREKYASSFDRELYMMGNHWAEHVRTFWNTGGVPNINGTMAYNFV